MPGGLPTVDVPAYSPNSTSTVLRIASRCLAFVSQREATLRSIRDKVVVVVVVVVVVIVAVCIVAVVLAVIVL